MPTSPIVGFVSPPCWCDPSPAEFQELCQGPVRTQQAMVDVPELDFNSLDAIGAAEPQVARASRLLGLAGASVIGMTGTPFVWAGQEDEAGARGRVERMSRAAGCPVIMTGTAIIDAVRALGVTKIAVATPYYTDFWRSHAAQILTSAGLKVLVIRSADQQGLASKITDIDDYDAVSTPDTFAKSLEDLVQAAPQAQALVCLGAGVRTLAHSARLEAQFGLPLVASDTALYWALARVAGVVIDADRLGRLGTV